MFVRSPRRASPAQSKRDEGGARDTAKMTSLASSQERGGRPLSMLIFSQAREGPAQLMRNEEEEGRESGGRDIRETIS